jgi:hypothetical protein
LIARVGLHTIGTAQQAPSPAMGIIHLVQTQSLPGSCRRGAALHPFILARSRLMSVRRAPQASYLPRTSASSISRSKIHPVAELFYNGFLLRGLQVRILLGSPALLMINQRLGTNLVSFRQEEPCCAALQVADSNFRALQVTTNSSTQHGRKTDFLASFASAGHGHHRPGTFCWPPDWCLHRCQAVTVQETLSCL